MKITLSEVWEHRVNTMSAARRQTADEIVEEALASLYFMTVAGGFPGRRSCPSARRRRRERGLASPAVGETHLCGSASAP